MRRLRAALAASIAALALQGCVAAAIPVVAGGALVTRAASGGMVGKPDLPTPTPMPRPAAAEPILRDTTPAMTLSDAGQATEPALQSPATTTRLVEASSAASSAPIAASSAKTSRLEKPIAIAGPQPRPPYLDRLVAHSTQPLASGSGARPPRSAMLSRPSLLDGKRLSCIGKGEAKRRSVLIDLDPAGGIFTPGSAIDPPPGLASALAELRAERIAVAWISGATAAEAADIRTALARSGLDPEGDDIVLLMRYPADRKQTRRQDLADATCLIAIAGDERADFDELYEHLARPEAALPLEAIFGNGWFEIPPLIAENASEP